MKVIKPGMDSEEVIVRFEAERQALVLLDHPNIPHMYTAGATEAGRPYFVMEYVEGVPIGIPEYMSPEQTDLKEKDIDKDVTRAFGQGQFGSFQPGWSADCLGKL